MTPEKQRIAIAEACGWTRQTEGMMWNENLRCARIIQGSNLADVRKKMQLSMDNCYIPDYLNDLNAMHEAEKVLGVEESENYMNQLQAITFQRDGDWGFCHANAAQRAEAFLKTLGKWE